MVTHPSNFDMIVLVCLTDCCVVTCVCVVEQMTSPGVGSPSSISSVFDPSGLVYGVASASGRVCLYSAKYPGQVRDIAGTKC